MGQLCLALEASKDILLGLLGSLTALHQPSKRNLPDVQVEPPEAQPMAPRHVLASQDVGLCSSSLASPHFLVSTFGETGEKQPIRSGGCQ